MFKDTSKKSLNKRESHMQCDDLISGSPLKQ